MNSIEASPYIDVSPSSILAKEKLYNALFEFGRVANKFGSRPEKQRGFWESDQGYQNRLNQWEREERQVLFEGWICKDMFHFQELQNKSTNTIITIEPNSYVVQHEGRKFEFPVLPDTINEFITDLKRISIRLFWKEEIAEIYGIDNICGNEKVVAYLNEIKRFNGSST
jgi:hypothetical protein